MKSEIIAPTPRKDNIIHDMKIAIPFIIDSIKNDNFEAAFAFLGNLYILSTFLHKEHQPKIFTYLLSKDRSKYSNTFAKEAMALVKKIQ